MRQIGERFVQSFKKIWRWPLIIAGKIDSRGFEMPRGYTIEPLDDRTVISPGRSVTSMTNYLKRRAIIALLLVTVSLHTASLVAQSPSGPLPVPEPLEPGAVVVPLWPSEKLNVKGDGGPEVFSRAKDKSGRVQSVTNIHNPSIEVHVAPPVKRNGTAIIVAPGGGNKTVVVGTEGTDVANWLNELGVSAFILRYRIQPYDSKVEAVADTQRAVRTVRTRADEWGVDPHRIGLMGFSAGGEQAAWVALKFDLGNPDTADKVERASCRPDFVVMVYPGWKYMDLNNVPKNVPPTFLTCAGLDDASHSTKTVQFYDALFEANMPVELHIYSHGGHGGGIGSRNGIPFGTWQVRFTDWAHDLGMLPRK
jgi:acetyl esterase/lipase